MADLNFAEYVAGLVEKARKAQAIANNFTQEDVDLITAAVTYNLTKPEKAKMYAEMLVEESGMGTLKTRLVRSMVRFGELISR